jgi:hypothetical protein
MLHYIVFHMFCNVALFRALFWDRSAVGKWGARERGIGSRWGVEDRGGFRSMHAGWAGSVLFPREGGQVLEADRHADAFARRMMGR